LFSNSIVRFGARALVLAGVAFTLPACATVTRGSSQEFTVQSTPPGARVRTSNGFECASTPCTFRMQRKTAFTATFEMDGYVSETRQVESKMAGAGAAGMAGNLLVGGIVGGVIDASSGAMNDLTPNPLLVEMQTPAERAAHPAPAAATTGAPQ
jgi:hypothetical protein